MSDRKSPLRDRPLRVPGQSIQERIDGLLTDRYDFYAFLTGAFVWLACYDWLRHFLKVPLSPWINTVLAAVIAAWAIPKVLAVRKEVRRLKQGRDGERVVAEVLDRLRAGGAVIFHDVKAPAFNVDHVIACKQGIYAIETKTYSKRRDSKIVFDGTTLLADGWKPDRDPVHQVRAISDWVVKALREGTAQTYRVKPVLVFPGWFVNPVREHGGSDVWVLNPEALPTFIAKEPERLTELELQAAVYFLGRLARSA